MLRWGTKARRFLNLLDLGCAPMKYKRCPELNFGNRYHQLATMASATILPTTDAPSYGHPENDSAIEWAQKLKSQLALVAEYDDIEQVPRSIRIDETILDAPRRKAADHAAANLALMIADAMYPDNHATHGPATQYEKGLVKLRKLVTLQRKRMIEDQTQRNQSVKWGPRILKQGAWDPATDPLSLNGAPSLPMPVQIAEPATLAPFFDHLALGGSDQKASTTYGHDEATEIKEPYYDTHALEFERGVTYSDGRVDLCKMVLGPNNIKALMESLKTNIFITHFLLGNNIIGPYGAKCIGEFAKEFPNRMDTWYLAGNCIDAPSLKILVDEWTRSISVTNIWLKRNPLGPTAAVDIFRLITETAHLRTLDLDQTELGDVGVAELFDKLVQHGKPVALRHVYMNANGISVKGAAAIAKYLSTTHCKLDSLYMTNNPLGNEGVIELITGLKTNKSVTRLMLSSVGMSDEGAIALCAQLEGHASLIALHIGQHYATEDLNARYNFITDRTAFALHNLIVSTPTLKYLDLSHCAMTNSGLSTVLEAVITSNLQFYRATTIHPQMRIPAAIHAAQQHAKLSTQAHATLLKNVQQAYGKSTTYDEFMANHKRWLVSDKVDVRKIDSVYRNRDAGLARRGLKKLDKWWDEDDETLKKVAGAVGPVCTLRKKASVAQQA